MAYKLRLKEITPHDYQNPDAQINVQLEIFDDTTGQVVAKGNHVYSGEALAQMTQAQVQKRLKDDALAWAAEVKTTATGNQEVAKNMQLIAKMQSLVGSETVIP